VLCRSADEAGPADSAAKVHADVAAVEHMSLEELCEAAGQTPIDWERVATLAVCPLEKK